MKVVLLLLLNIANGEQHIVSQSIPMSAEACDPLQRAVWNMPKASNPDAYVSPEGIVSQWDAACVPLDKL